MARSEVERREKYIQLLHKQLKEKYPLLLLVCQCLHNIADKRPSAKEVLQQLEAIRPKIGSQHTETEKECEKERLHRDVQVKGTSRYCHYSNTTHAKYKFRM